MIDTVEKFVVVADPHATVPVFEAVCNTYGDDVQYIVNGDIVDGPDTRRLIDRIISVGGKVVRGNHEQYLLGAMLESEDEPGGAERRRDIVDLWRNIHEGTLESYSIYSGPTPGSAIRLRDKMDELGHLALLRDSELYFEGNDFVVVHADITTKSWEAQKAQLDAEKARNLNGQYWGFSKNYLMPQQLGEQQTSINTANMARAGLTKRLISGHFHLNTRDLTRRSFNDGQHLLIAGGHNQGFAVVYESWTGQMRVIEA
jgi:Calcineurin-like phosphoesterase